MAADVSDRMTADGKKFQQMLKELAGMEVCIGFQHGEAAEDDGTDICDIAAWNELGTVRSPSRPFMRKSVDENEDIINDFLEEKKNDLINGVSAGQVMKEIGLFQKDLIQEKITEGDYVPNAASTVRRKGSDKPLIDTGRMRQSVNYVIRKKGGAKE